MRRHILVLLVISGLQFTCIAGWFTPDPKPSEPERVIRTEERLNAAQQQIEQQQRRLLRQEQTISHLNATLLVLGVGAVFLLIVGVALGSRAKRDEAQS